jgi:hypothetical protein
VGINYSTSPTEITYRVADDTYYVVFVSCVYIFKISKTALTYGVLPLMTALIDIVDDEKEKDKIEAPLHPPQTKCTVIYFLNPTVLPYSLVTLLHPLHIITTSMTV